MSPQKSRKKKLQLSGYAKFSGIAFQMIAIIGVGTYLGVFLDGKCPNKHSAYTLIFSLTSVIVSLYFVIRQILKMSKSNNDD